MASQEILLGSLFYILGIVLIWYSVYILRDSFKNVSKSIDPNLDWRMLYFVLLLLLIPIFITAYGSMYSLTSLSGIPLHLLRAISGVLSGLVLFVFTYKFKEISIFRKTPTSVKAIFILELLAGAFFSLFALEQQYQLSYFLGVVGTTFWGMSLSNIAVYAKQFERHSKIFVVLFLSALIVPLIGVIRAFFLSKYSVFLSSFNLSPDLITGILLLVLGVICFITLRKFKNIMYGIEASIELPSSPSPSIRNQKS